jgi:hypothetical protein
VVADMDDLESRLRKSIKQFDEWFQYAETIGQTRLYNFLMAFSILLAGCSVLLSAQKWVASTLSGFIAAGGLIVSFFSAVLGRRQIKFHDLIERQLHDRLKQYEALGGTDVTLIPVYHVHRLRDAAAKAPITRGKRKGHSLPDHPKEKHLTEIHLTTYEKNWSARKFLVMVPWVFTGLFALTLLFSAYEVYLQFPASLMLLKRGAACINSSH